MKVQLTIFMILILLSQVILGGCSVEEVKVGVEEKIAKPIEIMEVMKKQYLDKISISGNIKPSKTVKIAFKTAGVIEKINFEEGDFVGKGESLANLNSYQYRLNVDAAQSNYESLQLKVKSEIPSAINQAKSQLELIQKRYENVKKLYEEGLVAEDKLDEIKTTLVTIENKYQEALNSQEVHAKKLEQAKVLSELADSNLDDTNIFSPIDGIVVKKISEAGETTAPGYPIIVLGKLDNVEAEIGITDEHINKLCIGQKTNVYVYGIEKEFDGVITEIGAMADAKTRTFPVKITIGNEDLTLKPGMVAKVDITLKNLEIMLIPIDSIINMPKGPVVFVYSEKDGIVKERQIEAGEIVKDRVEVIGGLKEGEKVVIKGQFKLRDNDQVIVEGDRE